jgi:hypothetical protein
MILHSIPQSFLLLLHWFPVRYYCSSYRKQIQCSGWNSRYLLPCGTWFCFSVVTVLLLCVVVVFFIHSATGLSIVEAFFVFVSTPMCFEQMLLFCCSSSIFLLLQAADLHHCFLLLRTTISSQFSQALLSLLYQGSAAAIVVKVLNYH